MTKTKTIIEEEIEKFGKEYNRTHEDLDIENLIIYKLFLHSFALRIIESVREEVEGGKSDRRGLETLTNKGYKQRQKEVHQKFEEIIRELK